jgi:hypothetical protein
MKNFINRWYHRRIGRPIDRDIAWDTARGYKAAHACRRLSGVAAPELDEAQLGHQLV